MSTSRCRGFTLIELMVVVAVIALLAIIAIPSYLSQMRKSRRSDAIATMNTVALNEERWRTNCPQYAAFSEDYTTTCTTAGVNLMDPPSSSYYTFTIPTHTAAQYVVQAAAKSGSSQLRDKQFGTDCSTLTVCANLSGTAPCTTNLKSPATCFGQ